jgi:hypothetical protein
VDQFFDFCSTKKRQATMKENHYQEALNVIKDKRIYERLYAAVEKLEKQVADNVTNFDWSRPMVPSEDKINPDHYKAGGIETFDILRAKLSPTQLAGFCKGNVLKYIMRADHKDKVDDLKKAKWYLDKLIEELEKCES